jgi:putative NADH-flavin reductase
MKIAIFGATGHAGQFILRDALSAGHSASVLVRNPSKLPPGKYNMTIHLGDASDSDNVEDTIFGQQAVISALGLTANAHPGSVATAVAHIIEAMQANRVKRIVAIAGAGILLDKGGGMRIDSPTYPEQYRVYGMEHRRVYEALQGSDLDWTLICPPTMYDVEPGSAAGELRCELDTMPEHGKRAAYAAVARFALEALTADEYIRRRVGVAE